MEDFKVQIIETYSRTVFVEANNLEEALDIVGTQHEENEIELMGEYDHYVSVDFVGKLIS